MKSGNKSFAFIMELIIIIFFFALSTTVCMSFVVKAKEKQMAATSIQNQMLEAQSMIETMQSQPNVAPDQLFEIEKVNELTYRSQNLTITFLNTQLRHGNIQINNDQQVICEIPFVLGGTGYE